MGRVSGPFRRPGPGEQLAGIYSKWSAQILLQHRIILHLLLQSSAQTEAGCGARPNFPPGSTGLGDGPRWLEAAGPRCR
jgi:hypothetical protein